MRERIHIGTASIILIFILLCLSVFSLLSLSDGQSALTFAKRRAASVSAYYEADYAGQLFLHHFSRAAAEGRSFEEALAQAAEELPDGSESGFRPNGVPYCEIPMPAGQALCIEINIESGLPEVYRVYTKEEYTIDDSIPVWGS